jgi:intracellular multiplication protein IcmK
MKRILAALILLSCISTINVFAQTSDATQQAILQNVLRQQQQQQANPPAQNQTPAIPVTPPAPTPTPAPATAIGEGAMIPANDVGADTRDEAFAGMAQSELPMTPDQIRTLRKLYDQTQRAAAQFPGVPPKPTSSSIAVNLSPGATPPVIRLLSGFVTSLVFVDATGAPWPIKAYDLGDPTAFDIKWDKTSNTLLVQSITQYKAANLAVQLSGLDTPIMVTLLPGQMAVDYRVDLHVPALGPLAFPIQSGLPGTESPLLLNVLSGIPPSGSKQLSVSPNGYADVWLLNNKFYVRTRATVLSPSWISTISSSDGTHAYQMPVTPIMIVSQNGKPINLSVEGY